jgi:hypothetical protein
MLAVWARWRVGAVRMRWPVRLLLVLLLLLLPEQSAGGGGARLARARERARRLQQQQQPQQADDAESAEESLECGPKGGAYVSSLPAVGLHVITAPARACAGSDAATALSVFVDGLALTDAPAVLALRGISCVGSGSSVEGWLLAALRPRVEDQRLAQMEMLFDTGRMPGAALEVIMDLQRPPPGSAFELHFPVFCLPEKCRTYP